MVEISMIYDEKKMVPFVAFGVTLCTWTNRHGGTNHKATATFMAGAYAGISDEDVVVLRL